MNLNMYHDVAVGLALLCCLNSSAWASPQKERAGQSGKILLMESWASPIAVSLGARDGIRVGAVLCVTKNGRPTNSRMKVVEVYKTESVVEPLGASSDWLPGDEIAVALTGAPQQDDLQIDSLDTLRFQVPKEKARAELVDGHSGKAVHFSFDADARSTFFTSNIRGTPAWDKAEGLSFWVKGDGSDSLGGLQLIYDDDYAVRYDFAFPIKSKEWTKVTIAWRDLLPVLPGPRAKPLGGASGNLPSKITGLWFGRWWYWGDYPAHSFAVDDIRLEPRVPKDTKDYRPAGAPLARVLAKLKAGKPVTIVTMGDSLTDLRHWANRETAWPNLLRDALQQKYRSQVTVVNPAIGGTQLLQNLVLVPRWLQQTPEPDLVTVFFGGNDWDSGMRGPAFEWACREAVDRIRRATRGKADVLLMTTAPSVSQWETRAELAEACRRAAADRNAGLAEIERAFLKAGQAGRDKLFVSDGTHLNAEGHRLAVSAIIQALVAGDRDIRTTRAMAILGKSLGNRGFFSLY